MKQLMWKALVAISLMFVSLCVNAQGINVSGVVSDAMGPVSGVNVVVKGSTVGTITDMDGKYTISVPSDGTLVFSFVGYKEETVRVKGKSVINVTIQEDSEMLDELVVVGYGVQKKSDLATSVASVKADELVTYPSGSVAEMLRGRAAGVTVTSSSGQPGSTPTIQIRGTRSISASNTPLYIIDGSPADGSEFSSLSSEDIESIEILKDAASQAIYGARASDGVILVTTKRGKEGKTEVNYNGYVGVQSLTRNFDFYSPEEYLNLRREAKANDAGILDAKELSDEEALSDDIMYEAWTNKQFINWEDLMLDNAMYHNHELSIRTGGEKLKISASANYFDQEGMVTTGSRYQRASFRFNADLKVTKWLSFGVNSSATLSNTDKQDGSFNEFITRPPLAKVYEEDGSYTKYINSDGLPNPFYKAENFESKANSNSYRLNIFMDIKPFKGFNYRLNTSTFQRFKEDKTVRGKNYPGDPSSGSINNSRDNDWLIENILTYDTPIKNKNHKLIFTGVQSVNHNSSSGIGYSVINIPVDKGPDFIANGEFNGTPSRSYSENNIASFMLRAQYTLMDRYMLNVAMRADGSSRFGKNNKWGTFPSVALAWRMNQENFLKNVSWIDNLKLRISYGVVGNQNGIGNYTTLGLVDKYPYEFGDEYIMGYLPGVELSNPNLKWEKSATTNVGVDFSFFKGRLSGTVEYYNTHTNDLLIARQLNSSLGYTRMLDNLGKTKSEGVDITLNGDIVRIKDFAWSLGTNFSWFRNEILKIDDQLDEFGNPASQPGNSWFIGEPIHVYYDYITDGIFQYSDFDITKDEIGTPIYTQKPTIDTDGDGSPDKVLEYQNPVKPGMIKVKDLNGDGKINADDRTPISRDPDFTMSLTSSWRYKGWELFMDWYGVSGVKKRNNFLYDPNSGGSLQGKLNGIKVDYWTPFNPTNEFPRPSHNTNASYQSSLAIQDASYIRLRTLQLAYNFPKNWISHMGLTKLRLYATATNLFTATDFLSYSPELSAGAYPESRQFVFGINVSF